jgi:hypothetical protein
MAGLLDLVFSTSRPWRTSWLMVGIENVPKRLKTAKLLGKFRKAY